MTALAVLFLTGALAALGGLWAPPRAVKQGVRLGLLLALFLLIVAPSQSAFLGLFTLDPLARGVGLVAVLAALFASLVGSGYLEKTGIRAFEYHALLAFSAMGALAMAATENLAVILVGLELLSLPLYALVALRYDEQSEEAALKYLLLGAVAAALYFYGLVLYFGATGSFAVGAAAEGPLFAAGMVLLLSGLFFKAAMIPFGWWAPDVYQGAPTPVTLYMAAGVKAAAFAALLRVVVGAGYGGVWAAVLALAVLLTVVYGNLAALAQGEAKRLLAYSSIAHAGYIALALFGPSPAPAVGYYLLAYLLSTGLAFAVLTQVDAGEGVPFAALQGLIRKSPMLAGMLLLALLSLAGLPPLVGFWGKYLVFVEAARAGQYALLVIALLTAAVAAYYYLRLVAFAFFLPPEREGAVEVRPLAAFAMGLVAFLILALGFFPQAVYGLFAGS